MQSVIHKKTRLDKHLYKREFRAARTAEQKPSDIRLKFRSKQKEVITMVKQLQQKAGLNKKSTLVILGWLAFFGSYLATQPLWVVLLQSVARVLP